MRRRVVSLWFPRLGSDRVLRTKSVSGPFVLTLSQNNANQIYCLNAEAERQGLSQGMPFADARSFCPNLTSQEADTTKDALFLSALRRWATRYCPWVGIEGRDGLVMDITGSAHLFGGEAGMLMDIRQRLARIGVSVQIGLGDSRGAAWALAHYGEGCAEIGQPLAALSHLPVAALRLGDDAVMGLQRLGLRRIGEVEAAERAPLARRFGPDLLLRLDQALGRQPEQIAPENDPPHYGVRITLPEPIGLVHDVMAGVSRLLSRLCSKLKEQEVGARVLCLTLRRVDQDAQIVEVCLARALSDADRMLPLFERGVGEIDAGYGIDQMRLQAVQTEALPTVQLSHVPSKRSDRLADLITRLGTRLGLENIRRLLPADSHIPERSFVVASAAYSEPESSWFVVQPRPITLFPPEPIAATESRPPLRFRWRRMPMTSGRIVGPERIAPEWWLEDDLWRTGLRDYWRVDTTQGRRLWLFYTPQSPGWFVQGEFA
ncbi:MULTISPECIES: Y-family DNA polymerase [Halocynthiibacter]|uniref:DNA-directed DNA polymerase n=1 Tax=Halocynthiibacter halioticoli TaxID=2986804 RepID=A0AAE3LRQ5_9RHOB|nr:MULTISPECIES: DNA polymerase Y family protein [Halocynthiibacter]MCV6825822.1 DNA polymerase Y family protein [Halocynthiibacter halioticoli]MCW4058823.1 DNA polymerase Y family protein [Halocynthiibacter sp. SDUM655004]